MNQMSVTAPTKRSPISKFIRENRTRVLKPEMGTSPNVFYVGLDKEVM